MLPRRQPMPHDLRCRRQTQSRRIIPSTRITTSEVASFGLKAGTYRAFGTKPQLPSVRAEPGSPSRRRPAKVFRPYPSSRHRKNPGNWVKFKNLALTPNATSHTVLDGADGNVDGPPVIYGAYEGLRIHGLSVSVPIIFNVGLRHFIGCDMKDLGRSLNGPYSTTREHTPLLAGLHTELHHPGRHGWPRPPHVDQCGQHCEQGVLLLRGSKHRRHRGWHDPRGCAQVWHPRLQLRAWRGHDQLVRFQTDRSATAADLPSSRTCLSSSPTPPHPAST